jgi:tripartite-type tricarboxylate transporter receptor subunit TctC
MRKSGKPSAALPDIPTIDETGLPGFRAVTWYAIVAPPDTPAEIADKISRDVVAVTRDATVAETIRSKLQMDPIASTASEAAKTSPTTRSSGPR